MSATPRYTVRRGGAVIFASLAQADAERAYAARALVAANLPGAEAARAA